jgi:hypothetical protein
MSVKQNDTEVLSEVYFTDKYDCYTLGKFCLLVTLVYAPSPFKAQRRVIDEVLRRPRVAAHSVGHCSSQTYRTLKFVVGYLGLPTVRLTDGSVLYLCYEL